MSESRVSEQDKLADAWEAGANASYDRECRKNVAYHLDLDEKYKQWRNSLHWSMKWLFTSEERPIFWQPPH